MKRWPIILTKLIDTVHNLNHEMTMRATRRNNAVNSIQGDTWREKLDLENWEEKVAEGRAIIEEVSKLKYEMARDRALLYVVRFPPKCRQSLLCCPTS